MTRTIVEHTEEEIKAYREGLTPLSPEGRCPHCTEGLMDRHGNNDCDYNSYDGDGKTGVELHTHETTEHMILAISTKDWKKQFDFLGEGKFYKYQFNVVGKKMVTNGHCEACLEGLEEIRNQEIDREERWEDYEQWQNNRVYVHSCPNGHPLNDDEHYCLNCQ